MPIIFIVIVIFFKKISSLYYPFLPVTHICMVVTKYIFPPSCCSLTSSRLSKSMLMAKQQWSSAGLTEIIKYLFGNKQISLINVNCNTSLYCHKNEYQRLLQAGSGKGETREHAGVITLSSRKGNMFESGMEIL